jgi:3-keto-disaccharide hydrolase
MSITTFRAPVACIAFGLLSIAASEPAQAERAARAPAAEPIAVPMTADRWQTKENAEFLRQLGFYHGLMRLNSGNAVLKGVTFSDGTIEFDVNTIGRGSPGIAFRQQDDDNFELLYLRPDQACPAFRACMQYAPQTHGVLLWDLFPQYQTRAPLRENGWNHIRMVVSGRRMNVFVNDVPSPTLAVGRLEGDAMTGGLRLQGPATFANMVITPGAVDGLSPEPASDPSDADGGLVRHWRLSPFSALPGGKDAGYADMPGASPEWKTLSTERNGLANISRQYGRPLADSTRAVAWLKTTITSERKQTKKLDIGWTREVWVFVNGTLVYADKNLFEVDGARKFPDARCSLENATVDVPLEAGDNEIAVALANNFFGWGLMLRVKDPEGVHLAAQ